MGNVVRIKSTGEVIYRQSPNFPEGKGIKSAVFLKPKYSSGELEEKTYTKKQLSDDLKKKHDAQKAAKTAEKNALKEKTGWDDETIDKVKEYFR